MNVPFTGARMAQASLSSGAPAGFSRVGMRKTSGSSRSRNTS